jgi:hypothetical protein
MRAVTDAVEAKHFQAIRLLAQGRTFVEVAAISGATMGVCRAC